MESRCLLGYGLACVIFLAIALHSGARYASDVERLQSIIDEQKAEIEKLQSSSEISGGEEVAPEEVEPSEGYVFPVHKEDFLFNTSPFGLRVSPLLGVEMKHTGLDIATVWKAQVVSAANGTVVEHWPPPGDPYPGGGTYKGHPVLGGKVVVDHGDGVQSTYGHLSWTRVREGMNVSAGEILGRVGDTGQAKGMHLHFEISVNGEPVNPLLYVKEP